MQDARAQEEVLRTIAREAERLVELARRDDLGMVGFMLENVLNEARAELAARGLPTTTEAPPVGNVVKFER